MERSLNVQAYDQISVDYQEKYFSNEKLTPAFTEWLDLVPPSASILDIGCGHGNPVIGKLLESGHRVTGIDISPRMLAKAKLQYPQAEFLNLAPMDLTDESRYDAACSFSSLLYLDPIELRFSLAQIHRALKPGGTLFLYSFLSHPSWVGHPYLKVIGQYMWSWECNSEEAAIALEEYGLFEVIKVLDATSAEQHEIAVKSNSQNPPPSEEPISLDVGGHQIVIPPLPAPDQTLAHGFVVIAKKK